MNPKIITPPTITDVVSDATLRVHLKLASDGSEDENMAVERLGAHKAAEHYTGTAIGAQVLELALDEFPYGTAAITLPGGKVSSITSITYVDEDGATQTLATSVYDLDDYSLPCRAVLKYDQEWPDTRAVTNAVKVRYAAGEVAEAVKPALMLMVGFLHEHRGDAMDPDDIQPPAAKSLLNTVKRWGF
jgi:uncharacterized phiE125 gp8 family phage protein